MSPDCAARGGCSGRGEGAGQRSIPTGREEDDYATWLCQVGQTVAAGGGGKFARVRKANSETRKLGKAGICLLFSYSAINFPENYFVCRDL